jgi:transketolase
MVDGTGLKAFSERYPKRFFDVGICEGHAVTMASGMGMQGLKPVIAVYSSFLQRGYDMILHDICMQNLHVVLAVDRAGLVGEDGGIEIKCPYSSAVHARYLLMRSPADLKALKPEYYAQIQGNLLVTGRKWFDFVSYDPRVQNPAFALKVLRVERDEKMIAEIEEAITRATEYRDELLKQLMNI